MGFKKSKKHFKFPIRTLKEAILSLLSISLILFISWVGKSLDAPALPSSDQPIELYSTESNLHQTILSALDQARQSIILSIYSLTDPYVIALLSEKSQKGIDVTVVCDHEASKRADEKLDTRVKVIKRHSMGHMHHKIFIIDGKRIWLGSANMSSESLRRYDNLMMAINSPSLAQAASQKILGMKPDGGFIPMQHQTTNIGGQPAELWFLPDDTQAVERIKTLIRSAKKTIKVAMFTWTRQDFANEMIQAAKRGVEVEAIIDRATGKGASAKVYKLLKKNGIAVKLGSLSGALLHHKFAYIDGEILINGSANWTKAAFTQNDDCFMILFDLSEPQKNVLDTLWKNTFEKAG